MIGHGRFFSFKLFSLIALSLLFAGLPACQHFKINHTLVTKKQERGPLSSLPSSSALSTLTPSKNEALQPPKGPIKVGLILGPGGLRSFAHIGVLQELWRSKIPLKAIVGIELGSLVGAISSAKGQPYNAEWQMMKLQEKDFKKQSLFRSGELQDVQVLNPFLQNIFGNLKNEGAKVEFSCPSYNFEKRQTFMMNRGLYISFLPYCLPSIPFYKPHGQSVAASTALSLSAKYLRSKGINYIIYVDLLSDKEATFLRQNDSAIYTYWVTVAQSIENQLAEVDKVIPVSLSGLYLDDFSQRREMILKGQESVRLLLSQIINELETLP